jgi:hypothetical protein
MSENEALLWNLVEHLKAHAMKNYNVSGWSVIVECWSDQMLFDALASDDCRTSADAIASFEGVVSVWGDQMADAMNSAF